MKKTTMFATILGAATLTLAGAALAAEAVPGADGGASTLLWTAPVAPGQPVQWMPSGSTDPRADSIAMAKPSSAPYTESPASAIGMEVITADGATIGEIDSIAGSQIVVSVGSQLGVGTHDVVLYWPQLRPVGTGDDMKLQTTLTSAEIRALPQFKL
ncbi:MAG: hypothetical protein IH626_06365 [Rhodospirillales bacterium]|nr:hypothetical protein [Rhodospirillales bacterium]